MVGQYFLAAAAPPPNVYFPEESVCSASPAMFKCDISNAIYKHKNDERSTIELELFLVSTK